MREMPMFPLGTVLLPHMVLPLHVFEPRYRALLEDVLADGREFGVVLIARGQEVGGGDERTDVGTVARIVRAEPLDGDRWLVIAVGDRRIRVERWLPDDPYPRAMVSEVEEVHDEPALAGALAEVVPGLRRVLALSAELGQDDLQIAFDAAGDVPVACWQTAVLSPLTPLDAQRVLAVDHCPTRLRLLTQLLAEVEETLALALRQQE